MWKWRHSSVLKHVSDLSSSFSLLIFSCHWASVCFGGENWAQLALTSNRTLNVREFCCGFPRLHPYSLRPGLVLFAETLVLCGFPRLYPYSLRPGLVLFAEHFRVRWYQFQWVVFEHTFTHLAELCDLPVLYRYELVII